MANQTKIEWADSTFNPWVGCTKVSAGCAHCYAEQSTPARALGVPWGPASPRRRTSAKNWKLPLRWQDQSPEFYLQHERRRRVFCASLADVFDAEVDPTWRNDLWDLVARTPDLDWLLLTKRPENFDAFLPSGFAGDPFFGHVWLGVSVEDQKRADERIGLLLQQQASVLFLSMEPLLGPVSIRRLFQRDVRNESEPLGERDLPSSALPRAGDRRAWADMENQETNVGQMEDGSSDDCMRAMQGREQASEGLPPGEVDVRERAIPRTGASPGLETFPRRDPGWDGRESSQRSQGGQQAGEPGDLDSERERQARSARASGGTMRQPERNGEPQGEAVNDASPRHPSQMERGPDADRDCQGVRSSAPDDLWNLQMHHARLWVICGGESGREYRDCDPAWIESIARQCEAAGVACFVKQDSARIPGQRGRLSDYAWSFKQHPDMPRGGS